MFGGRETSKNAEWVLPPPRGYPLSCFVERNPPTGRTQTRTHALPAHVSLSRARVVHARYPHLAASAIHT